MSEQGQLADAAREEKATGNLLIDLMPDESRERILEEAELIDADRDAELFSSGELIDHTIFPLAPTMVSLVVDADPERSCEVATIGREGAIGGMVSCGDLPAFSRAAIQVPGRILRVPMGAIDAVKRDDPVVRELFCRYADALLAQVMQSVACNAFHPIEARAARWLLTAQDRSGDELHLTQGSLAVLLGVQRTSVNAVARQLQDQGLIRYRRGVVEVRDRDGLERSACPCYEAVADHFDRVLGERGAQWMDDCVAD